MAEIVSVDRILRMVFQVVASKRGYSKSTMERFRPVGASVSESFRWYYESWGRYRPASSSFCRLRAPKDWEVDRGKLMFADENQGVCRWGVGLEPKTMDRVYQQPAAAEGWFTEPEPTTSFLLTFALWNSVNGGLHYSSGPWSELFKPERNDQFRDVQSILPLKDRNVRIWVRPGGVVFCHRTGRGWSSRMGSRTKPLC